MIIELTEEQVLKIIIERLHETISVAEGEITGSLYVGKEDIEVKFKGMVQGI